MWRCPGVGEGGKEPDGEAGKGTAAAATRRSASEMSMLVVCSETGHHCGK